MLGGIIAVEEAHADDLASFLADLGTTGGRGPETPESWTLKYRELNGLPGQCPCPGARFGKYATLQVR